MAKSSKEIEIITFLKMQQANTAVLALLKHHVENADAELLSCSAKDDSLRDKLVKSQTLRSLYLYLEESLK